MDTVLALGGVSTRLNQIVSECALTHEPVRADIVLVECADVLKVNVVWFRITGLDETKSFYLPKAGVWVDEMVDVAISFGHYGDIRIGVE